MWLYCTCEFSYLFFKWLPFKLIVFRLVQDSEVDMERGQYMEGSMKIGESMGKIRQRSDVRSVHNILDNLQFF